MPYPITVALGVGAIAQQAMTVLYQHRLVSTDQLHRLLTPHHTRAEYMRRQLHRLRMAGLADAVGRRAHGQTSLLWWLTAKGAQAVEAAGLLPSRPYRMSPEAAAGPLQEHTLATVETGISFAHWARKLGHDCGPLDWSPEIAHYFREESRPGEDLSLVPDAVLSYVHTDARKRTLLTFFVEIDRATMTVARLAHKLHAYACYQKYVPQGGARTPSTRRRSTNSPSAQAWRSRYPVFPRLLIVFTGAPRPRLERRIADLRSLAASNPVLLAQPLRAGATTLDQLQRVGPFAPIFTPILGSDDPTDAWLHHEAIPALPPGERDRDFPTKTAAAKGC
ncbi:replication-relaxation family protein [Kitasatospora sp. NPDC057904]|uniref:replication-relaxation family protein n=1 Tax=unclassified Kitasatospora TaxID=2633591 RepID=UPI0036DBC415